MLGSNPAHIYCSMSKENVSKDMKIVGGMQSRQVAEELVHGHIQAEGLKVSYCGDISTHHLHMFVSPCNLFFHSVWP